MLLNKKLITMGTEPDIIIYSTDVTMKLQMGARREGFTFDRFWSFFVVVCVFLYIYVPLYTLTC